VENRGAQAGVASVLWFLRDPVASITRPLRELKHFASAELAPGEARVFRWEIVPERDLTFPDAEGRLRLEPGGFEIRVEDRVRNFTLRAS